jgi:hypothetical protein
MRAVCLQDMNKHSHILHVRGCVLGRVLGSKGDRNEGCVPAGHK